MSQQAEDGAIAADQADDLQDMTCRVCGEELVFDDSPGVINHVNAKGDIDYAMDRDHVGIPEEEPECQL